MKKCNYCGAEIADDSLFCTECGKPISPDNICPHCGASVNDGDAFCQSCGKRIDERQPTPSSESSSTSQNENVETSDYNQIDEDAEPNPSSNKTILVIIGIFVLALIGGGWYGFKTYKANNEVKKERYSIPIDTDSIVSGASTKEIITKRLEEIFEDVNNGKAKDCDERYFSSEFKQIFKKVEDIDRRIAEDGSIGFWDFTFWEKSQELVVMKVFVDDVCDIKANEATAKLTIKRTIDGNTFTEKQDIRIVFEDGKWVLDDWYGYKNEMKKFYEENKDYQPSAEQSNIDWLQGHWVYQQGNYKGHFVIEGNTITQYSSMNPEHITNSFRIEGNELYAGEMTVTLDLTNHRIDYGDGNWMHKVN